MHYVLLKNRLNELGLKGPRLSLLQMDGNLYKSLLFQPKEDLESGDNFLRYANRDRAGHKFQEYFNVANEENVELAITPEYSCPWDIVQGLFTTDTLPGEAGIWVIGCELITAGELNDVISGHQDITWIYEAQKVEENLDTQLFFDPLCYIFKTRSIANNELTTVVIIQFKTHPMGGTVWERDSLIQGHDIYILENNTDSTRLVTYICSDVLTPNFDVSDLPNFAIYPYFLIHIQLNQSPTNLNYLRYRGGIYGQGRNDIDIVCLNWGRNISLDGESWNSYGGSALYFATVKDRDINDEDDRLNNNHNLGLYYTKWRDRYAHIYFLNYDEHIFLYRNTKPSQRLAQPANQGKTGPQMLRLLVWQNETNRWIDQERANSGFTELCAELVALGTFETVLTGYEESPVNIERLISLSIGEAQVKNWHYPKINRFFKVADNEINARMTFTQNPCQEMHQERLENLQKLGTLEYEIIAHSNVHFPGPIADLINNCILSYQPTSPNEPEKFLLNLYPQNNHGVPATGVFVGQKTADMAENILDKTADLFSSNQNGKRVVVWYFQMNGQINKVFIADKPKVTDNPSISSRSIIKPE